MRISDWSSDVCSSDLPSSRLGPLSPAERAAVIQSSAVAGKYEAAVNRESAHEMLAERAGEAVVADDAAPAQRSGGAAGGGGWIGRVGKKLVMAVAGRTEERRVGQGGVSTCRSRWWAYT